MSDSQSGEDGGLGDDFDESDEDLELDDDEEHFDLFDRSRGGKKKKPRLEMNELQELLKDAETDISDLALTADDAASPRRKRRKAEKEPLSPNEEETTSEPAKKKRKTDKKDKDATKPQATVFDLVEPEFEYSTSRPAPPPSASDVADSFGEQTVLHTFDAADKKARKKSLRFHTSKIEGAATRRGKGAKNLLGGDEDIPYKERKKQKDIREAREIEKKGRGQGGDDLSDGDPEMDVDAGFAEFDGDIARRKPGMKRSWDELDEGVDPGEYYSLVETSAKERKEKRKSEHDAAKAAQRCVFPTTVPHTCPLTGVI